jgi:hypothetical protein
LTENDNQNQERKSYFDIKTTDDYWAYMWLFGIARNHYVTARVCVLSGLTQTGCFLAHQCIEAYLKAIARASNSPEKQVYYFHKDDPTQSGKIRIWGHDLLELTKKVATSAPSLNTILDDDDSRYFLGKLTVAYDPMRYGEANFTFKAIVVAQWLDKVVATLDSLYHEKRGAKGATEIFVPSALRADFLRENKAFTPEQVTDWPFDSHRLGMKMPSSLEDLYWKARKEAESKKKKQTKG